MKIKGKSVDQKKSDAKGRGYSGELLFPHSIQVMSGSTLKAAIVSDRRMFASNKLPKKFFSGA